MIALNNGSEANTVPIFGSAFVRISLQRIPHYYAVFSRYQDEAVQAASQSGNRGNHDIMGRQSARQHEEKKRQSHADKAERPCLFLLNRKSVDEKPLRYN
ncbi:hypothetical protein ACFFLZ_20745 [Photobacterium aphoticum]|uniref:Uncharacterized protein n=1 Tax=Photobacterium aphoticum TaxID=754436 RepID=A0A0J1JKC8_9GAMM|nr:hypothetical protein [Photobacterium aphoticum]KLV02552.1 hypothetical protein ABT58_02595 [Photobacterium aphoticum]PSU54582.1 hypothetical protein C9I90_19925 [Photobacterium aphoticum]